MRINAKRGFILCAFFSLLIIIGLPTSTKAANYTAYNETQLKQYLELPSSDTVTLGSTIILNSRITIKANKVLDLNNQILLAKTGAFASSGGFNLTNTQNFTDFTIKNGSIQGGPTNGLGADSSNAGVIFAEDKAYNLKVTAENIRHDGDGFFKGHSTDLIFKGKMYLQNTKFNARALNITMFGNPFNENDPGNVDFYGYVDFEGTTDPWAIGQGGVNLSFDGYDHNNATAIGKTTKNLEVPKNAKVKLVNKQKKYNLEYSNNVGNFAQINVDGEFIAEAEGTPLRTTAARYNNQVGTPSDQSEVNVKPGSIFKISSFDVNSTYGTIYTYSVDINVNNPKIFDIRAFGNGRFFHGWPERNKNNFRIYNSDVGVWAKKEKGIGNPLYLWQNVKLIEILKFDNGDSQASLLKKTTTNPAEIAPKFYINDFSRISNDVALPQIVPDKKVVGNNETSISGRTEYVLPDGTVVDKVAAGAKMTMIVGGKDYTTTADQNGKWSFNNLPLSTVSGGSTATITLVDADKRYGNPAYVVLEDKTPPKAEPKLIKAKLNDMNNLNDPKLSLVDYSDETTAKSLLKVEYVTTLEERQKMLKEVGKYDVKIKVTDAAGNFTIVDAPVIVHNPTEVITNGFASAKDFEIDYDKWVSATDAQKRSIMLSEEYGNLKGYEIQGNTVTDVSNILAKMTIDFSGRTWEPKKTYPIQVKVMSYTKTVNVTLIPAAVKMNVKQIYSGTDKPIYQDLSANQPVDNGKEYEVKIGDSLEEVVNNLIATGKIKLNYAGYNQVSVKDFVVKVNNNVVATTKVPDQAFQLIYQYQGQMKFDKAPDLNFGKIEVSKDDQISKLATTSQDQVSIINTFLDYGWTLKASLPKGITNKQSGEEFLGELLYIDSAGVRHSINKSGAELISQKSTDKSLSTIDIRGNQTSGMRLEQHIGNTRNDYSGELVWTLEDGPK
ncbi:hypothetical protein [Vagococcus hydrophili]|uniref:Bacterial Ig domain-containing protein n=1 Tax=Vagococcus hydrophili TaxID=2714947 RepID=A0A6G8ATD5_9ENTE|nr:hypothetical protein [Vagococcus hydrophili]QIL48229.1 hypothetical protein G7082_06865 [Vagococcus hydrophili]